MRKGILVFSACAAVILLAGAYFVGTSAADAPARRGAAIAKPGGIASDPDGDDFLLKGGVPCPVNANPCEANCSPASCSETDLGVSACVQPNGAVISCQQIGETVWHRHCLCQNGQKLFCAPQVGDDPILGQDTYICR